MRRVATLSLLLCLPTLAFANEPMQLGGSWKVPAASGGVLGTVRLRATERPHVYKARFILGDGSVKELDATFDGETLTTSAGATAAAGDAHPGAVGALEGGASGDTDTTTPASATTGSYRLRRSFTMINGTRKPSYRFIANGDVDPNGLTPVHAFARVAIQVGINGPRILRHGDKARFSAAVQPSDVPGATSWSVRGAYALFYVRNGRLHLEARTAGTVRVFCRFTPEGGTQGTVYETTHFVEVKPAFASVSIASVTYRSDHGVLKEFEGGWNDGGTVISEPEWTPTAQHPISHTFGEKVKVRVTLNVTPKDAPVFSAYLRGDGPGDLDFRKRVRLRGGRQTVTLTSVAKLPESIQEYDLRIKWRYTLRDTTQGPEIGETATTAFLTMGDPATPSRRTGITTKRMRQAIKAISGSSSQDPHAIAKHVIGKWNHFNLDVAYWNAWELGDDKTNPETGELVGADCQTIVRYTENVIGMAGVPGKAEFIVVWAKVKKPEKARANPVSDGHMGNPRQYHNDHFDDVDDRAGWIAYLIDGNNRPNNYEAALRFTHGGQKLYYPGGVLAVMENADEVLRVFGSMSWVDSRDGYKVKDAIVEY